jgi:hypothetical protein
MQSQILDIPFVRFPEVPRNLDRIHFSDIIRHYNLYFLGKKYKDLQGDKNDPSNFDYGFLWEEMASLAFGNLSSCRPEPRELDKIIMSPDGLDERKLVNPLGGILEYKATKMKAVPTVIYNDSWIKQGLAYCKGWGVDNVLYLVWYINGEYRNSGSIFLPELITFTQDEINTNWRFFQDYARMNNLLK